MDGWKGKEMRGRELSDEELVERLKAHRERIGGLLRASNGGEKPPESGGEKRRSACL